METFELSALEIRHNDTAHSLTFARAELVVVTEAYEKSWYIDVTETTNAALLDYFSRSEDIRIELSAITKSGTVLRGTGYLHANAPVRSAAIRGVGELAGYAAV